MRSVLGFLRRHAGWFVAVALGSFLGWKAGGGLRPNVMRLELAGEVDRATGVISAWVEADPAHGLDRARHAVYWDFPFIGCYVGLLGVASWKVAGALERRAVERGAPVWPHQVAGWVVPGLIVLAGALDVGENLCLLPMLKVGGDVARFSPLSRGFALPKFALVGFGIAYVVLGGAALRWTCLRELGRVLERTRASILVLVVGAVAFIGVPQGQDILLRLTEDARGSVWRVPIALLFVLIWSASTWYWARVALYLAFPGTRRTLPGLRTWMPRVLGPACALATGAGFVRVAASVPGVEVDAALLGAACVVIAGALFWFATKRRDLVARLRLPIAQAVVQYPSVRQLPPLTRRLAVGGLAASLLILAALTAWPVAMGQALGTVAVVTLTFAVWALLGAALAVVGARYRFPSFTALLLVAAFFGLWNDNHDVHTVDSQSPRTVEARTSLDARLDAWYVARRAERPEGDIPLFLVAASGGGVRAALVTGTALAGLQARDVRFARHVFAISGVSGGSLGAAVFESLLPWDPDERVLGLSARVEGVLGHDFLSPALAMALGPDSFQRLLPFPCRGFDRSRGLESGWESAGGAEADLASPFLDLWKEERDLSRPLLFLNGTHVETGRRAIVSPVSWEAAELPDALDLLGTIGRDMPLSAAAHASARFPVISPAGTFWDRYGAVGHVVDGGYFENAGATTVADVLDVVERRRLKDVCPYVLHVSNDPYVQVKGASGVERVKRVDSRRLPGTGGLDGGLIEARAPFDALFHARDARGTVAVEHLRGRLAGRFVEIGLCGSSDGAPLPLGWQLSEASRRSIVDLFSRTCPGLDNAAAARVLVSALQGRPQVARTPDRAAGQAAPERVEASGMR